MMTVCVFMCACVCACVCVCERVCVCGGGGEGLVLRQGAYDKL